MQVIHLNAYNLQNFDDNMSQNSLAQQSYITETISQQKRKKTGKWSDEEDQLLRQMVRDFGEKSWKKISEKMHGRSAVQCIHRWTKILKPGLVKGSWSTQEDELLKQWVIANGANNWAQVSLIIKGRSGKQCRERWFNNLNPNVKKGNWTAEEDQIIFQQYQIHSSSWSKIAQALPGRTENSIKNRFYSTIRKITMEKEKCQNLPAKLIGLDQDEMENNILDSINFDLKKKFVKLSSDDSKSTYDAQLSNHDELVDFDKEITDFNDIFSEPDFDELNLNEGEKQQGCGKKENKYNNKLYKLLSTSCLNLPQQQSQSVNGTLMRKNKKKYNYKKSFQEKKQQKLMMKQLDTCPIIEYNQSELPLPQPCGQNYQDPYLNMMSQQKFDNLLNNIEKTLDQELDIANLDNNNTDNIDKLQDQIFDFCNQTNISYNDNFGDNQIPSKQKITDFNFKEDYNLQFSQNQPLTNLYEIDPFCSINQNINKNSSQISTQNIMEQIKLTQDLYESSQSQLAQIQEQGSNNKMINFLINSLQTLENLLVSTKEEIQKIEKKSNKNPQSYTPEQNNFVPLPKMEEIMNATSLPMLNVCDNEYNNNKQLSESSKNIQQKLLQELEQIDTDDYQNEFNDLQTDSSILELLNKQNLISNYEQSLIQQEQQLLASNSKLEAQNNANNLFFNLNNNNNINCQLFDLDNDKYFINSDNQYDIDQIPFVLEF